MRLSTPASNRRIPHGPVLARLGVLTAALSLTAAGVATAAPAQHHHESLKAQLHKLRLCESGNHWHEDTGNGYYGAYQFAPTTWHSLGHHGRPDHAKPVYQNRAARQLHAINGWQAWPSCAKTEHLTD